MYLMSTGTAINDMGHWFSRLELESELLDGFSCNYEVVGSPAPKRPPTSLDHEIAQLTKLRSEPHENLSRVLHGKRESPISTVKMLAGREANYSGRGRFSKADRCHVLSKYLPVNGPWVVDQMSSRAYVSQFSADGSLFVAAFQGSHIRIYDVERGWKVQKNILARSLRWTVTDTSFSPDQRNLVYATMSPIVHIVNVGSATTESLANITEVHDGMDLSDDDNGGYSFGIFSVKFSTDGREIVAGSSDDAIYVYDLEAKQLTLRISAHKSDVNSVCFADESGHLIFSGSDDNLCKVWDRRCFRVKGKPAGVLIGHLEGITFLDSRGDSRYFISNGKDQTIKLWDIRNMSSNSPWYAQFVALLSLPKNCVIQLYQNIVVMLLYQNIFSLISKTWLTLILFCENMGWFKVMVLVFLFSNLGFRNYEWDYRWMDYPPQARELKHPGDQSVATYRGHSVLRTLIRCYFSPEYSTGQKYIYTGSYDSCIHIYDLVTGAQVAKLQYHKSTIRDCSWHPSYPMLVSSSWDGDVVKWEFPGNGEGPVSMKQERGRRHRY